MINIISEFLTIYDINKLLLLKIINNDEFNNIIKYRKYLYNNNLIYNNYNNLILSTKNSGFISKKNCIKCNKKTFKTQVFIKKRLCNNCIWRTLITKKYIEKKYKITNNDLKRVYYCIFQQQKVNYIYYNLDTIIDINSLIT